MSTRKSKKCPKDNEYLCGNKTLARGLCVKTRKECKTRTTDKRPIPTLSAAGQGANYGYEDADLGRGCYSKDLVMSYEKINEVYDDLGSSFKLMTYNIWGLDKPKLRKLFSLRKDLLLRTIKSQNADLLCFQEMSAFAYSEIKDFIGTYKFASEVPFLNTTQTRGHAVEVYFVSRFVPRRVAVYSLPGVLGYTNSMIIIEYSKLVIFNLYNQAGSKYSIGQEEKWVHYARCRYDLINIIYDMIKTKYKGFSVIVCGDFNFHLDGTKEEWPESDIVTKMKRDKFVDTYRSLNKDLGLTENTDTNLMRYNQKLIEKKFRFDAILYKSVRGWRPVRSHVFGKELEYLNDEDSEWFYNTISEASHKGIPALELRGVKRHGRGYRLPINASDHFGVVTSFSK